jgi:uroporphyrinogen-III synthase
VDAFFRRLDFLGLKNIPLNLSVAVVGAMTATYILEHGIRVDYFPDEYLSEAMLSGFGENIHGTRFLFPQSNLARTALADGIRSAGGHVSQVVAYCTVLNDPDQSELKELRAGVDVVTFTSPSTIKKFITIVRKNGLDPRNLPGDPLMACIGPVTEQAAKEAGLPNLIAAKEYTTAGLLAALQSPEAI